MHLSSSSDHYNKAHELKVVMKYNLYAKLRDFVLNFSLCPLLLSNISRACYIRARQATWANTQF